MSSHTHQTAPTKFVEAKGNRFAYRRFGKTGSVPLVFNIHFAGTMDHWDPVVTDGFAKDREVILFDNVGISSSSGEVPASLTPEAQEVFGATYAEPDHLWLRVHFSPAEKSQAGSGTDFSGTHRIGQNPRRRGHERLRGARPPHHAGRALRRHLVRHHDAARDRHGDLTSDSWRGRPITRRA
jgi:hypothetical protein